MSRRAFAFPCVFAVWQQVSVSEPLTSKLTCEWGTGHESVMGRD
jgi:hypothetical protein